MWGNNLHPLWHQLLFGSNKQDYCTRQSCMTGKHKRLKIPDSLLIVKTKQTADQRRYSKSALLLHLIGCFLVPDFQHHLIQSVHYSRTFPFICNPLFGTAYSSFPLHSKYTHSLAKQSKKQMPLYTVTKAALFEKNHTVVITQILWLWFKLR